VAVQTSSERRRRSAIPSPVTNALSKLRFSILMN
jgi:hypothetical protein